MGCADAILRELATIPRDWPKPEIRAASPNAFANDARSPRAHRQAESDTRLLASMAGSVLVDTGHVLVLMDDNHKPTGIDCKSPDLYATEADRQLARTSTEALTPADKRDMKAIEARIRVAQERLTEA